MRLLALDLEQRVESRLIDLVSDVESGLCGVVVLAEQYAEAIALLCQGLAYLPQRLDLTNQAFDLAVTQGTAEAGVVRHVIRHSALTEQPAAP